MKLLIKGGNGKIGSAYQPPYSWEVKRYGIEAMDITNREMVKRVMKYEKPDVILHLAGLTQGSNEDLYRVNVLGTANILEYGKKFANRIVLASSSAVYPRGKRVRAVEGIVEPANYYGKTRRLVESLILSSEMRACILRLFNVYGRGFDSLLDKAMRGEKLTLRKNCYRDYIHIDKVCEALNLALSGEGVYNVGSGEARASVDLADDFDFDYEVEGGDLDYCVADITKFNNWKNALSERGEDFRKI